MINLSTNTEDFNFVDLKIEIQDNSRIFDITSSTNNKFVVGVIDCEHNSTAQIYEILNGKAFLTKKIGLTKQPISMDANENFGVFGYRKTKKDRSFAELVHLESGEVVKTLELGQENKKVSCLKKNQWSAYRKMEIR